MRKQIAYWKSLNRLEMYTVLVFMAGAWIKTLTWLLRGV